MKRARIWIQGVARRGCLDPDPAQVSLDAQAASKNKGNDYKLNPPQVGDKIQKFFVPGMDPGAFEFIAFITFDTMQLIGNAIPEKIRPDPSPGELHQAWIRNDI